MKCTRNENEQVDVTKQHTMSTHPLFAELNVREPQVDITLHTQPHLTHVIAVTIIIIIVGSRRQRQRIHCASIKTSPFTAFFELQNKTGSVSLYCKRRHFKTASI